MTQIFSFVHSQVSELPCSRPHLGQTPFASQLQMHAYHILLLRNSNPTPVFLHKGYGYELLHDISKSVAAADATCLTTDWITEQILRDLQLNVKNMTVYIRIKSHIMFLLSYSVMAKYNAPELISKVDMKDIFYGTCGAHMANS